MRTTYLNFDLPVLPETPRRQVPAVQPAGETTPPLLSADQWQAWVPQMQLDACPGDFDIRQGQPMQPQLSSPAQQSQFLPADAGMAVPSFAPQQFSPQFTPQFAPQFAPQPSTPQGMAQEQWQQASQSPQPADVTADVRAIQQQQMQQQMQQMQQQMQQMQSQQPQQMQMPSQQPQQMQMQQPQQQFGLLPQLGMAPYMPQNGQMQGQMQGQMPQGAVWLMPVMYPMNQAWSGEQPQYPEPQFQAEEPARRKPRGRGRDDPLPHNASPALRQLREDANSVQFAHVLENAVEFALDSAGSRAVMNWLTASHDTAQALAHRLAPHVLRLSVSRSGCRVVQKVLDSASQVSLDDKVRLLDGLRHRVTQCIESEHGNHVVQKAIEELPPVCVQFVVDEYCAALSQLAVHRYGCRLLQRILEQGTQEQKQPILDHVQRHLGRLCKDEYGNYGVCHVLKYGRDEDREHIVRHIERQALELTTHKFGSNVVEKALLEGISVTRIAKAMVGPAHGAEKRFARLAGERFASYVLQKLLDNAEPRVQREVHALLLAQTENLKKSSHGKHILDKLQEVEARPHFRPHYP